MQLKDIYNNSFELILLFNLSKQLQLNSSIINDKGNVCRHVEIKMYITLIVPSIK